LDQPGLPLLHLETASEIVDPVITHRSTIEGHTELSEDANLEVRSSLDQENPGSAPSAPTISLKELRNSLLLPLDSGWNWWNPGFKTAAGSPQYLNECNMVNDECIVRKTIKIDLENLAAYLIIPKLPLIKRVPFSSLKELQAVVNAFHNAPLCLGFNNEKFQPSEKTKVGFFSNGSWRSTR